MNAACVASIASTPQTAASSERDLAAPLHRPEEQVAEERDHRDRQHDRRADGEGLGVRQGPEELAFLVGQGEDGDERDDRVGDRRDDGPADLGRALVDDPEVALRRLLLLGGARRGGGRCSPS